MPIRENVKRGWERSLHFLDDIVGIEVSHGLRRIFGRGGTDENTQPQSRQTRKAVDTILDLYPSVRPQDIDDTRVNNAEWDAGQGKGDPDYISICQATSVHEERNRRIREHMAARADAESIGKRHDRLEWYEKIPDKQKRELELLEDKALRRLFQEDDLTERNLILKAVVDKTTLEKIRDAASKLPAVWDQFENYARQAYTQLSPAGRAVADKWSSWAERKRQKREHGGTPAISRFRWLRWLVFVPGVIGVAIIVAAFIRVML